MTRQEEDDLLRENGYTHLSIIEWMQTLAETELHEISYGEARKSLIESIIRSNNLGLVRE